MNEASQPSASLKIPPALSLPPALGEDLHEANALPEIAVLCDPTPEVLEAYGYEEGLGVIALVSTGPAARALALELGALEVIDPLQAEVESRLRVKSAVARFRSRLKLERTRDELHREIEAQERNLRLAARLQHSLLPPTLPELEGVRFSTAYLPQEFVSGDSYEVRQLGPHLVALYTLDSVGHGVRAALLTVLLRSLTEFADSAGEPRDPHEVVDSLNRALLDAKLEESPTAAFCYGLIDTQRRTIRLANAGHPLPIRLAPDGTWSRLGRSGLLLGVDPECYQTVEEAFSPGDRVFFFTDGADPDYTDAFCDRLAEHVGLELELQVGGALGSVIVLDDEGRPEDDVTVVAVSFA